MGLPLCLRYTAMGRVIVAGSTQSDDFPTTPGAFDTKLQQRLFFGDAFVAKLQPRPEAA